MLQKRRRFRRAEAERFYRKLFIIATEGSVTEQGYFNLFNNEKSQIQIHCIHRSHKSKPTAVLATMKKWLQGKELEPTDEAWLVVDKDQWPDDQLRLLHEWSLEQSNYGFALSNPKFEFWLLLHFEDGSGAGVSRTCDQRLKQHLAITDKRINSRLFTPEKIQNAIERAEARDHPPCIDWPKQPGRSTVYRLVKRILKSD